MRYEYHYRGERQKIKMGRKTLFRLNGWCGLGLRRRKKASKIGENCFNRGVSHMNRKTLAAAFPLTIPVLMGYLAIGIAFGLMLQSAG